MWIYQSFIIYSLCLPSFDGARHRRALAGGEGVNASFDKKTVQRLQDIQSLDEETQNMLFRLIDTIIRDTKAKKAYS